MADVIAQVRARPRRRGKDDRRGGLPARQRRQPHAPDRPHRRGARRRGKRGVRTQADQLPLPPLLDARTMFDGYRIVREIHASQPQPHLSGRRCRNRGRWSRSRFRRSTCATIPAYLKRFLMEEWIARRIDSPHVLKPCPQSRPRNYLYVATEFIEGQTLTQWMIDQSEARSGDGARHRRADRQGPARLSSQGDAASGSPARRTS